MNDFDLSPEFAEIANVYENSKINDMPTTSQFNLLLKCLDRQMENITIEDWQYIELFAKPFLDKLKK